MYRFAGEANKSIRIATLPQHEAKENVKDLVFLFHMKKNPIQAQLGALKLSSFFFLIGIAAVLFGKADSERILREANLWLLFTLLIATLETEAAVFILW